ncbi:DgyrCDS10325 [Dimorphilus gyrociliatus]|uniref:DgyrCDS10325 n=1 Tax=Dimorphilus gyrociliatus TaxID=2664684 RepID=A0A7I8VZU2_9ANNE|nr:DgyrCDS10325 [Dimorphilus gyrociliatus]
MSINIPTDPGTLLIGDTIMRYKIVKKLGQGSFGQVYEADNMERFQPFKVAIKVEVKDPFSKGQGIKMDKEVLKSVRSLSEANQFFCQYYGLSEQMLNAIDCLHSFGFVHRDIKPSNFAIKDPIKNRRTAIVLLDFGLTRRIGKKAKGHLMMREPRKNPGFRGTIRYASINAMFFNEQGFHDDLWSWLYVTIEMITGLLPWKQERDFVRIRRIKIQELEYPTVLDDILFEFSTIKGHLRELSYGDIPDYGHLRASIQSIIKAKLIDYLDNFDWELTEDNNLNRCQTLNQRESTYAEKQISQENNVPIFYILPARKRIEFVQ